MFGDTVRAHRQRLGITQEELAATTGISARQIRAIETGRIARPRPGTVRLLADAFDLRGADRDRFQEPLLAAQTPNAAVPAQAPNAAVPAQLPVDVSGFTGRVDQLDQLDRTAAAGRHPTAVIISALSGTAGVGKTALAVHWAHRVRGRFPDGQLYVNLRGFDPRGTAVCPDDALRGFLEALAVAPQRIPTGQEARAALYRSLLAGRRMLVVLDNARDADQVRPLLPGAAGCFVLVTSRNRLPGLVAAEGAHPLVLDLLSPAEARELLTGRIGAQRAAAEPGAVAELIVRCARLPLALAVAAARAATNPGMSLAALASELGDARGSLDALATGDAATDVRAVLSWSYRALPPDPARLFRLLGLHPGPDFTVPAAASLAGIPVTQARPLLAVLVRGHLLAEHTPGRYVFHDLLRAYTAELTRTVDSETERRAAVHRLLDHYVQTAHAAALLLNPHREPIPLAAPGSGSAHQPLADHGEAFTWFSTEHQVLLAAIELAATTGLDTHTCQLAWTLADFLDRQGHWHDRAATQHAALAAARRLADPSAEAAAHRGIAHAYGDLGRHDEAQAHYRQALDLLVEAGDQVGQARVHVGLAWISQRQHSYVESLAHAQQAHDLFQAAGHHAWQAVALNTLGWCHAQLGRYHEAIIHCRRSLAMQEEAGNRHGAAGAWDSIGYAHHHLGEYPQAITCYRHAVDLYREAGDRYVEADTLTHLGDTHHAAGDIDAARAAYDRAVRILDELDHPDAAKVHAKLSEHR